MLSLKMVDQCHPGKRLHLGSLDSVLYFEHYPAVQLWVVQELLDLFVLDYSEP